MIRDILRDRKIKPVARKKDSKAAQNFDANFCMINLVVEDLVNAKDGVQNIESLKQMFKTSNDPSESDKLYKQCQEENSKTDKLIKKGKKMLEQEQKDLKGRPNAEILQKAPKLENGSTFLEPEIIFRKMCVGALQMKIFEMIKTVQKMQMEIKRESQQKMKDRIKMYDNSMEDDELEELIKDPEVS